MLTSICGDVVRLSAESNLSLNLSKLLLQAQDLFRQFYNVEIFTDGDDCHRFIKSKSNKSFIIIVSGRLSRTLVPEIHELPHISAIYIYCQDQVRHSEWSKNFAKVRRLLLLVCNLIIMLYFIVFWAD